ncbi:MAG: DUF1640 domain-containing protein [Magnetococcales bacterium]|nr:DUF1640 domain-containing protein [Magnetococcales bacterium]
MTAITFDTYAYIKELKDVGFTEEQAAVQAKTLSSIFRSNLDDLATRRDLKELEMATKRDINALEMATKRDLKELDAKMDVKLSETKAELIKWMFGVAAGQAAFLLTMMKLFPGH